MQIAPKKIRLKTSGVAFPTVLWLLIIIVAIGTTLLILLSYSYLSASKHRHEQGAHYLAYSGIMVAKVKLNENSAFATPGTGEVVTLPTGTALITATPDASGNLVVKSIGRYGQSGKVLATATIQATINTSGVVEWDNL